MGGIPVRGMHPRSGRCVKRTLRWGVPVRGACPALGGIPVRREDTGDGSSEVIFVISTAMFVALNGTYTNIGKDGNLASVAIVIILEVNDGKIIREDWYYDNSPFY